MNKLYHIEQLSLFVSSKVCKVCHIEKPIDEFYKSVGGKDGYTVRCKKCLIEDQGWTNHKTPLPTPHLGHKICSKCLKEKSLTEFTKNKAGRDGLEPLCKECKRAYHREYSYKTGSRKKPIELPEPINGGRVCIECKIEKPLECFKQIRYNKDGYSGLCKECLNAKARVYYAIPEHREKKLEGNHQWYEQNSERHHEMMRAWSLANPGKISEIHRRYSSQKKGSTIEVVDYERVWERCGCYCYICEGEILPHHKIEFDHRIPISRHGPHTEDNIYAVHKQCNRRKSSRFLEEMTPYQRRGVK